MADYVSVLTGGTNNFATTSEHLNSLATDILSEGVVGAVANSVGIAPMTGGLAVNAQGTPNMTVAVTAGKAYVEATPSGQASQLLRANIAAQNVTISSNSTGGTRYDWLYVKIDAANAANPNAAGDNVASLVTSRSTSASTDNGTPPTYGYAIAVITVANGATSITNGNIADVRTSVVVSNNATNDGWINLSSAPNTITYNGNRNYDLVYNSVDHSDVLSPGMKIKLTRTVAAPDQCADLEASSSQYFSKTSPAGMTFTDDWTCMAWVKLESYAQGIIMGRMNSTNTNGWQFYVDTTGRVNIQGTSSPNSRTYTSYASLPINKWIHVAGTLDMSGASGKLYFDGVEVAGAISGTATSLTLGSTFGIGANAIGGTPGNFFDGKIAQAAVFSSVLNESTIRSYISQGLSGTESTLVSAYSFDNSLNDLNTTNANNLTGNGGAVATDNDSPYANNVSAGLQEYAEINSVTFSTNTTVNVRVPDTCMIPTSGGITSTYYTVGVNPYGLPYFSKILGIAILNAGAATTSTSDTQVNGLRTAIIAPKNARLKISLYARNVYNTSNGQFVVATIYEGTVGSGRRLGELWGGTSGVTGYPVTSASHVVEYTNISTSSVTFNAGLRSGSGGSASMDGTINGPVLFMVELA